MSDFWANKTVLITGGHGFLGRRLTGMVCSTSAAYVVTPSRNEYDLRNRSDIEEMLGVFRPDIVIHLAARVGGIGANQRTPGTYFYDNAIMGIELLEQCRLSGVGKIVLLGTICSYPKRTPVPFMTDRLWHGYPEETNAAYGLSKKMLLVQAQAYRQQYGTNAIYLMPTNLYGPGDNFDADSSHVIPALIRKILDAKDRGLSHVELWGTGTASREFLYVDDAARAIALATERYDGDDPVNIGSGHEMMIHGLASMIAELCEYDGQFLWDQTKPDGQPRRCLHTGPAKSLFGFEATTTLREGLSRTLEWWRQRRTPPRGRG